MALASRHTEHPSLREINLTLTPSEFSALRDHLTNLTSLKGDLAEVVGKVITLDARINETMRLQRRFTRHD